MGCTQFVMNSSRILLFVMGAFWQPTAGKHTHGHAQVGVQHRKIKPFLLFTYTKLCLQNSSPSNASRKTWWMGPERALLPCLRLQWLAGIWHSINTESWQLERPEGCSWIACICLLTPLVRHSSSHSLPAGMTPLRDLPSTNGPRLRCNQEQLARYTPNKYNYRLLLNLNWIGNLGGTESVKTNTSQNEDLKLSAKISSPLKLHIYTHAAYCLSLYDAYFERIFSCILVKSFTSYSPPFPSGYTLLKTF